MGAHLDTDLEQAEATAIFSPQRIRARLEGDPAHRAARFRDTLDWGSMRLLQLFQDGVSAAALVHARALLVDNLLIAGWQAEIPTTTPDLALIAVGGYGRGELLPHSDIDILVLIEDDARASQGAALQRFFALLWDIGLEPGHSVRSVSDCVAQASADLTVITNLIEARPLCGDSALFDTLVTAIAPDKLWPVDAFYRAKRDEQARRYRKYDDTGYKLEPNVKESPGGLRDIHTVAWVAKRHFGVSSLAALREHGFLTRAEWKELFAGQDFLWRVRFALHTIAGRHEDRLLFDYQTRVAEAFGYVGDDHNLAVEQFMQLYYRTIKSLSRLDDMLLQLFDEAILGRNAMAVPVALNERFRQRGDTIEATDDKVFTRDPKALLEIFAVMQRTPGIRGIRAHTLRLMWRDLYRMDDAVRRDPATRALFIGLFRRGDGLTHALNRMNRYGVLGRYLPAFERIVGRMQYDLFHTLTVDEHSLRVVGNLRAPVAPSPSTELPLVSHVIQRIERPELLYIAGLMHDMAKGRGGDHSEIGAEEAAAFCRDHGIEEQGTALVAWLVRNHLLMSLTAQRQDIADPDIVAAFAERVGNRQRLDHLYLLTVADIRATNPALWNSWRDALLKELYHATVRALERGLDNPIGENERVAEQQRATLNLLAAEGTDTHVIEVTLQRFENDYFLRHSPRELAWQLRSIATVGEDGLPLIHVDTLEGRGTMVFVYMHDRDHLFALTAGVLARLGLSILDARLSTTDDGYALDTWVIMEGDGHPTRDPVRHTEIRDALRKVLTDAIATEVPVNRRLPRVLAHFDTPTKVSFRPDIARNRTILQLTASDRPGLLALVGRAFGRRGIRIDAAKIGTIGERVEDAFFITDAAGRPIEDPKLQQALARQLKRTIDQPHRKPSTATAKEQHR